MLQASYTQLFLKTNLNFNVLVMDTNGTIEYLNLLQNLTNINTSDVNISKLFDYIEPIYESELEDRYSVPMFAVGFFIAVASLWCVLVMLADLVHGVTSNKLWIPCKYFSLDALSLAVIAVAIKLPVDLSGSMPGAVDQVAKLGSMAFMCTMMANLVPSLATMESKGLLANVTGLGVLVITLVINVCIQIGTGVIVKRGKEIDKPLEPLPTRGNGPEGLRYAANKIVNRLYELKEKEPQIIGLLNYSGVATIYVVMLLLLLIIHVSSSLAVLESKKNIQRKYQRVAAADGSQPSTASKNLLTVEKLKKHVSKYWVMAGSGSPQFIAACSATTTAAGFISFLTFIMHCATMVYIILKIGSVSFGSVYKSSTVVIFVVQSIGVVLDTAAPLLRCVVPIWNVKSVFNRKEVVYKVERYWTQTLYDGKYGSISRQFRSHKLKVAITKAKNLILNLCIVLQKGVVLVCKLLASGVAFYMLIPLFLVKVYSSRRTSRTDQMFAQRKYVLQLETDDELAVKTLKGLLNSLDQLIQKGENIQPKKLMKLITEKSTNGFQGVRKYDNDDPHDCWSLPVVTLTTITITLPNIDRVEVENLLKSVREGLAYVTLVEENLNVVNDEYESIQKAAAVLWEEVDLHKKWLGNGLKDIATQARTAPEIVQLFSKEAIKITESRVGNTDTDQSPDRYSECIPICAKSMSRITQTIIDDKESHNNLFEVLSVRITDILAACLTNLPEVIAMKCHTDVIEKREEHVEAAAKLLGETKQIITTFQGPLQDKWHAYLSMTTDDLRFIKNWRAHLSEP